MKKKTIGITLAIMIVTSLLAGCGERVEDDRAEKIPTSEIKTAQDDGIMPESEPEEVEEPTEEAEARVEKQEPTPESEPEEVEEPTEEAAAGAEKQEMILGDDGSVEIYAARKIISLSDDMIVGQVALEDILEGNPILYDRVIIDGYVVEWILTDYKDKKSSLIEEGVLVISKENDAENTQVIRVQGRGGDWGPPASLANKFEYMDVNFDDVPDLLICTGHHGTQGSITYYCFLQTDTGFVEAPTFTEIQNPSVDTENKLILGQWRNWAVSHSWAEYAYQDNTYVLYRELCEELKILGEGQDAIEVWVWTVNGEEIGRSDQLSESEIEDLIYNENSEWRLMDDRWRTIYNDGLMKDYSIYGEP